MTRLAWLYGTDRQAVAEIQMPEPDPPAVVRWEGRTFVHTALNRDMQPFPAAAGVSVYVEASIDLRVKTAALIPRYRLSVYDDYGSGPWIQETRTDVPNAKTENSEPEDAEWCRWEDVKAAIARMASA